MTKTDVEAAEWDDCDSIEMSGGVSIRDLLLFPHLFQFTFQHIATLLNIYVLLILLQLKIKIFYNIYKSI